MCHVICSLDKKPIPATYNFRTPARDSFDVLNFGKKDKVRPRTSLIYTSYNYCFLFS